MRGDRTLAAAIPLELAEQLAALGTPDQVADRIRAYLHAGADTVAVIPVTAEDPGGRTAFGCAADICSKQLTSQGGCLVNPVNTQCRLAARPVDLPKATDWSIVEEPKPVAAEGEFVVQVDYLSIDPAMRTWMNAGRSYVPPVEIGEVMRALGVGHVVESRHPGFAVGDDVSGIFGVQRYALSDGAEVNKLDTTLAPATTYLGALGISGLTAYFGLLDVGRPEPGQTVLVSGAAGSVGSIVGTDCADQRMPRGRYRRWRRQMPLAGRGGRIRRRDRLQGCRPA